jgi:hypothetical protein
MLFAMTDNKWARLSAHIAGMVNSDCYGQCEYLAAENRILRAQLPNRLRLLDPQRANLAEIGKTLRGTLLADVASDSGMMASSRCAEV